MNTNDLEFRISQYIDGTLPARQATELEQQMVVDEVTRALMQEYRQVDQYIKLAAGPLPEVDYDALSARIGDAVAEIDAQPDVIYSFKWIKSAVGVAVAACMTLGVGIWMSNSMTTADRTVVQVELPKAQVMSAPAIAHVSIGPSSASHAQGGISIEEALVTRPTKLLIASAGVTSQDEATPY